MTITKSPALHMKLLVWPTTLRPVNGSTKYATKNPTIATRPTREYKREVVTAQPTALAKN